MASNILDRVAISLEPPFLAPLDVLLALPLGEPPLVGAQDLLAPGELELGPAQCLHSNLGVVVAAADTHQHLANGHTGGGTLRLAIGVPHTSLKPISSCTRKHFVDTHDVVGMGANTDVVGFLSGVLGEVLVAGNTGSLKGLTGQLFLLIRHQVNNAWKVIYPSLLLAYIIDSDLGVWDTTTVPRLDERLVLLETVAPCRSSAHPERGSLKSRFNMQPPE
mmetsp:Transcript_5413/g.8170  ORF Transcript_5413/g.8170 Transcript_5413/m.8170 type:complete len:220 (-) Transcript_5413:34-693(-)